MDCADLNAAEVGLAELDEAEDGDGHGQPDQSDGDQEGSGQHGLPPRSRGSGHQPGGLLVEAQGEPEGGVDDRSGSTAPGRG